MSEIDVLAAIDALQPNAYGVPIRKWLQEAGVGDSLGQQYTICDRLEQQGLIRSWQGEGTPERGNKPRCLYELTDAGRRALNEAAIRTLRLAEDFG